MKSAGPNTSAHRSQSPGVLDLRLDPRPPGRQARLPFDLAEQQVQPYDVVRRRHLGQDDGVDPPAGDDVQHVTVRPLGGRVVDPDRDQTAAPVAADRDGRVRPGLHLGARRDGVLEIQEHLVGGQIAALGTLAPCQGA
jgi:hypothetical protein